MQIKPSGVVDVCFEGILLCLSAHFLVCPVQQRRTSGVMEYVNTAEHMQTLNEAQFPCGTDNITPEMQNLY